MVYTCLCEFPLGTDRLTGDSEWPLAVIGCQPCVRLAICPVCAPSHDL